MSETVKEKASNRSRILDEYEKEIGLPSLKLYQVDVEFQNYFVMDRKQIEKLSPRECSVIAFRLSQYSFFLQRSINRERSMLTYAKLQLDAIVAKHSGDFDKYTKHEVKESNICASNSAAMEWKRIQITAQQRIDRLDSLAKGVDSLAYRISMVQKQNGGE